MYFYPRTPCGVRLFTGGSYVPLMKFLSTYPVRGTTPLSGRYGKREEHFYPRTPCGVRLDLAGKLVSTGAFLSTYPVRGTTIYPRSSCSSP